MIKMNEMEATTVQKEENALTLEEVRAIQTEEPHDGFTAQSHNGEPLGGKPSAASDFTTAADEDFSDLRRYAT